MSDRLLTVSEAAEYLRLAPEVVRRKVREGKLRARRLNGSRAIRFTLADLRRATNGSK